MTSWRLSPPFFSLPQIIIIISRINLNLRSSFFLLGPSLPICLCLPKSSASHRICAIVCFFSFSLDLHTFSIFNLFPCPLDFTFTLFFSFYCCSCSFTIFFLTLPPVPFPPVAIFLIRNSCLISGSPHRLQSGSPREKRYLKRKGKKEKEKRKGK